MEIEKTFRVQAPQAEVWEFITCAEKVATCLPGVEEVHVQSPGKYKGVMNIKVGPIKTSVNADVEEMEQRVPEFASYSIKGEEGGRASHLKADAVLSLASIAANETEVSFTSNVVIVGRLGKFAGGVMNKLADSMSNEFVTAFRAQLEPQPVVTDLPVQDSGLGILGRFFAWLRRLFGGK